MTDLRPLTALGHSAPMQTIIGPFSACERSDLGIASLVSTAPVSPFGLSLPDAGHMTSNGAGDMAIWSGQNQWMILSDGAGDTDFAAKLAEDLTPALCKITEQTDAWVAFEISGNEMALSAALSHLVNLPLQTLTTGCAMRTLVHHMNVFVIRPDAGKVIFLGMRSQAGSLWHALDSVMQRI